MSLRCSSSFWQVLSGTRQAHAPGPRASTSVTSTRSATASRRGAAVTACIAKAPGWLIRLFCPRFAQEVGLPSHTAAFEEQPGGSGGSWWRPGGGGGVVRVRGPGGTHVCTLSLPRAPAAPAPRLTLRLPSFSGATAAQPALLRYSLALRANVRPVAPAAVAAPQQRQAHPQHAREAVLRGRPLLTLAFDAMEMDVGQPQRVATAVAAAGTAKKAGLARA